MEGGCTIYIIKMLEVSSLARTMSNRVFCLFICCTFEKTSLCLMNTYYLSPGFHHSLDTMIDLLVPYSGRVTLNVAGRYAEL